jgi:hypothetical protein
MATNSPQKTQQQHPSQHLTNDPFFEDAKKWFNNMNPMSRNQMIVTMYKLCLTTRDVSHEKLIE